MCSTESIVYYIFIELLVLNTYLYVCKGWLKNGFSKIASKCHVENTYSIKYFK